MRKYHKLSKHHRYPKSWENSNNTDISIVTEVQHCSWHNLFYNYAPEQIAKIINDIWLPPSYEFVVRKKDH